MSETTDRIRDAAQRLRGEFPTRDVGDVEINGQTWRRILVGDAAKVAELCDAVRSGAITGDRAGAEFDTMFPRMLDAALDPRTGLVSAEFVAMQKEVLAAGINSSALNEWRGTQIRLAQRGMAQFETWRNVDVFVGGNHIGHADEVQMTPTSTENVFDQISQAIKGLSTCFQAVSISGRLSASTYEALHVPLRDMPPDVRAYFRRRDRYHRRYARGKR